MMESYTTGKAFKGFGKRDTIKPDGAGDKSLTVDQRIANGESPPGPCPFPNCGENHWLKHCHKKAAKERTDRAKAKKAKAAKKAAKSEAPCEVCSDDDDASQSSGRAKLAVLNESGSAEPSALDISQLFSGAAGEQRSIQFGNVPTRGSVGSMRMLTTGSQDAQRGVPAVQDGLRLDFIAAPDAAKLSPSTKSDP